MASATNTVVDDAWNHLLGNRDLGPEVRRMIAAAAVRLELRRLYPYLSLGKRMKFSTRPEYPYSVGYPTLAYIDPNAVLDGPAFELWAGNNAPVARGDLEHLLDLLVELLPT